jgi:site-specific recombinase XerD
MIKIVDKYKTFLTNKNYSIRTIEVYSHYLKLAIKDIGVNPYQITTKQIESYLLSRTYTSISLQNQIIGSLKLFAKYILGRSDLHLDKIERPRKVSKLPQIIDAELLVDRITKIKNLKHKTILTLGLSCGLRISEVINLKWIDLDRERNVLNVVNGKGKKDRCTILNDNLILLFENYYRKFNSKEYVFNGQSKSQYSTTSIQNIVKKYIHPKASFHLLRHSYCTYALDNGTEIKPLSISMGHKNVSTTEIYFHVTKNTLNTIKQAI